MPDIAVAADANTLVKVDNLNKYYPLASGLFSRVRHYIHAVEGVSFTVDAGEVLGLAGESGCGKTTTGKLLLRLIAPTKGHIYFNGVDVARISSGSALKAYRRQVQMIFQDPYESMNPRKTLYDIVAEPLTVHRIGNIVGREQVVADSLARVGLVPPETFLFRYPHELSGGQRQRVAIARAIGIKPKFIVADEPTSMLDVSIRTGVMKLLHELRQEYNLAMLDITHDLAVARYMCDRLAIMYLGRVVELGPTEEVLQNPLHPYTKALISAVPVPDPTFKREAIPIKGSISRPVDPPAYCRFYPRCPVATDHCRETTHPPLADKGGGHYVACYNV